MLERLGRTAARRHRVVIGLWVVVAIALLVVAHRQGGAYRDVFTIPGTQSQEAADILAEHFPAANGATALVVFHSTTGPVTGAAQVAAINASVANLAKVPGAQTTTNPTQPAFAGNVAPDGTTAYATVVFPANVTTVPADTMDALTAAAAPAVQAGMDVQFGGAVVDYLNQPQSEISKNADKIGLAIAVVILLVALGSVVSMAVPISLALVGLLCSSLILEIVAAHITIGKVAPILGTMIGLGVGIDYSLFIVSRHRQNLASGMDVETSAGRALATSGSAVLFAAVAVCLALGGLALIRIPYLTTLGLSAALYVAVTVVAALTLLPAVLGLLGRHIDGWSIHHRNEADPGRTLSARWAHEVARRPVLFCLVSLAVLLALAIPLFHIELSLPTDSSAPTSTTQRQAYDLLSQNFGPGVNAPLLVVVPLETPATDPSVQAELTKLAAAVAAAPGVAKATPAIPSPTGGASIMEVTPSTGPTDPATTDLVHTLRSQTIPGVIASTTPSAIGAPVVGGLTATSIDLTQLIKERLAPFIGGVVLGAFLLLMMVFRSLFVPFKAAAMNLLSIGAAYGFVVAVFQWGWGRGAIGLQETVAIVAFVPVMMFAILFGLSMDYEVFLLSRIKEDYDRSGDSHTSVVNGLASTARVITSAALIMISVFLAFVTNPSPTVKMMGLGMAVAVFVDASIVRMMLVPATMEIAGRWNWWIPSWLDRVLPHINVDRPEPHDAPATATVAHPREKVSSGT
ncbi:MAG TPA: MMPL family transporter [Acidimicrobiales bacterium]